MCHPGRGNALQVGGDGEVYEEFGARDGCAGRDDREDEGGGEGEAVGGGDQDMCGDDSETEGDPGGAGDPYHGDRVGGEGGRDR